MQLPKLSRCVFSLFDLITHSDRIELVVQGPPYYGNLADIWSSGVVSFAMIARRLPFDNDHIPTLLKSIKMGHYHLDESIKIIGKELVERSLKKDVKEMITVSSQVYLVVGNITADYVNLTTHSSRRSPNILTSPLVLHLSCNNCLKLNLQFRIASRKRGSLSVSLI